MRALVVLVVAAGCGRYNFADDPLDAAVSVSWWDRDFTTRVSLDLDRYAPTADLGDFPMLVALDSAHLDRTLARADLGDLRFVTDDGTVLDHELDVSADLTGVLAWVRMPILRAGEHPRLWLYDGNPAATARTGSVWSASYAAVWHLADGKDATGGHDDGTLTRATGVAGAIGKGIDFAAGMNGYIRIPDAPALHWAANAVTVSGWLKLRSYQQTYSAMIAREQPTSGVWNDFHLGTGTQKVQGQMFTTAAHQIYGSTVPLGTWTQLAMVFDGTQGLVYRDGKPEATMPITGTLGASTKPIYLGADCNSAAGTPDTDFVDGTIDEIRIETVARPASWLAADHVAATDGWITYGVPETLP